MSQLQETLNNLKNKQLPARTTFGDLQGIVPKPYSKFDNMENPRPRLAKFYMKDNPNFDRPEAKDHDCHASAEDGCEGCKAIREILNQ